MLLPLRASPQLESGIRQTGSPSCSDIKYKPQGCCTWHCVSFGVVPNEKRNVFVCLGSGLKTFHFWRHRDNNTQQKERFPNSKHPLPPLLLKKRSPFPLEPSSSCSAVIVPLRGVFFFPYNFSLPNSPVPCAEGRGLMFSPVRVCPASHWLLPTPGSWKSDFWGHERWPSADLGKWTALQSSSNLPSWSIPGHSVLLHRHSGTPRRRFPTSLLSSLLSYQTWQHSGTKLKNWLLPNAGFWRYSEIDILLSQIIGDKSFKFQG